MDKAGMEMDLAIALFVKEQQERAEEEKRARIWEKIDPKARIKYTVEELAEGIRKGELFLYTLKMEFTPREVLAGRFIMPYIKDFFDMEVDKSEAVILLSNKRKVSASISDVPCREVAQPLDEWVSQTKEMMEEKHRRIKPVRKKSLGKMEYFCFTLTTAEGRLYNVAFRLQKGDRLYTGALNCPVEEQEGMGLLLEAIVHIIWEMNGQEGGPEDGGN